MIDGIYSNISVNGYPIGRIDHLGKFSSGQRLSGQVRNNLSRDLSRLPAGKLRILLSGFFSLPARFSSCRREEANFFSWNIFLVICFIYLLQGLAIVSFFFQIKNVPNFFRFLFYFLIAVQQILMIPIAAIGLFDIWVDFRKFFQKDQTTD